VSDESTDTNAEPIWLDPRAVVLIHQRQLAEHGGPSGLRDQGMLESALAAPRQQLAYGSVDLFDLAACYGHLLAGNHPFVDGNKRTAWVCTRLFLRLNGIDIDASTRQKLSIMLGVSSGAVDQSAFADWLRRHGCAWDGRDKT
jgi:death-on-curing protein